MKITCIALATMVSFSFAEISGDIIAGYLDEMGGDLVYERAGNEFMLFATTEDSTLIPYMYILADSEMEGCLLAALTPGFVPDSGTDRTAALETLSELNWNNTWVKFVSDPETGEVSAIYTFSTENNLGFESFEVMINLLLGTVDENWEILSTL